MDWAKFIEENSQSLFTLGAAFLGSLLTLLGVFINNLFQAKQRKEDREEQRRERKIQANEKWIERDISEIMDSIDAVLSNLSTVRSIHMRSGLIENWKEKGYFSEDDYSDEVKSYFKELGFSLTEFTQAFAKIARLTSSFGEELSSEYKTLTDKCNSYTSSMNEEGEQERWWSICESTGKMQLMLREKLISIRDS